MSKEPFEKVRSLVERKRLFVELIDAKAEIVCKSADESLFAFFPEKMLSDSLIVGSIQEIENVPGAGDIAVVGNFAAGEDRYFLNGNLKVTKLEGVIHANTDIYKLQRRQNSRVIIPDDMKMSFTLKSLNGQIFFTVGKFFDLSIGGARVYFPSANIKKVGQPEPRVGMPFAAILNMYPGRIIELEGEVKHALMLPNGEIHYGLQIKMDRSGVKNRLTSLVMDIQHKIVIGLS